MAEITIACRNGMVPAKPVVDDDEDDAPGRILTVEEFMERLRNRTDIFGVEKSHRLRNAEVVALLFGLAAGFFAVSREPVETAVKKALLPDRGPESLVMISPDGVDRNLKKPTAINRPKPDAEGRKPYAGNKPGIADSRRSSDGTGGGDARSRVASNKFFTKLAESMRGIDSERGEIFGQGGFAEKLDAIISGSGGRQHGGKTQTGRRELVPIGDGPGNFGSGYDGDGAGSNGDIFDEIYSAGSSDFSLSPTRGPPARLINSVVRIPERGVRLGDGGRSRAEIMRVVLQNISALRYAYNQRLREKPGLNGQITIKFAIDEFGRVIACEVLSTSMNDQQLEAAIRGKIFRWTFDTINKPGDITEVVYPFVFST